MNQDHQSSPLSSENDFILWRLGFICF